MAIINDFAIFYLFLLVPKDDHKQRITMYAMISPLAQILYGPPPYGDHPWINMEMATFYLKSIQPE